MLRTKRADGQSTPNSACRNQKGAGRAARGMYTVQGIHAQHPVRMRKVLRSCESRRHCEVDDRGDIQPTLYCVISTHTQTRARAQRKDNKEVRLTHHCKHKSCSTARRPARCHPGAHHSHDYNRPYALEAMQANVGLHHHTGVNHLWVCLRGVMPSASLRYSCLFLFEEVRAEKRSG